MKPTHARNMRTIYILPELYWMDELLPFQSYYCVVYLIKRSDEISNSDKSIKSMDIENSRKYNLSNSMNNFRK